MIKGKTSLNKKLLAISITIFLIISCSSKSAFANDENNHENNNLFDFFSQVITSFTDYLNIPDLGSIFSLIIGNTENPNQEGSELASNVENQPRDSYSIKEDIVEKTEQDLAIQVANDTALTQEAQTDEINLAQAVETNMLENVQLAQESQNLDVTQQIMQNISQQIALNGQTQGILIHQNQETQLNQALGNLLNATTAEAVSENNTAQRREKLAAGKTSIIQAGLLLLPGGVTLDSTDEDL